MIRRRASCLYKPAPLSTSHFFFLIVSGSCCCPAVAFPSRVELTDSTRHFSSCHCTLVQSGGGPSGLRRNTFLSTSACDYACTGWFPEGCGGPTYFLEPFVDQVYDSSLASNEEHSELVVFQDRDTSIFGPLFSLTLPAGLER